jgi:hypothetical protein
MKQKDLKMKKDKKDEMKKEMKGVHVAFRMTDKDVEVLDKFARQLGLTRTQLIRNLISTGLDDLYLANSFGMISIIGFIRKHNIQPQHLMELAFGENEC